MPRIERAEFDVWDGVLVDGVLYVKASPDPSEFAERTQEVLARLKLQSQPPPGSN